MAMKYADVVGSKAVGYELRVMLVSTTSAFHSMNHKRFDNYREAQDVANAIHAFAVTRKARGKKRGQS